MKYISDLTRGIWKENPVLVQILGICPTLAVTNSGANAVGMALSATFVLLCSSVMVSLVKKCFKAEVRIMGYIVIIAAFVTLADMILKAKFPILSKDLGPYVPLIVVNCIILGRAEAFASKNGVFRSALDALGNGMGFLLALTTLGVIREILGSGSVFGFPFVANIGEVLPKSIQGLYNEWTMPWLAMILAPGAFFGLSVMIAAKRTIDKRLEKKS